MELPSRSPSGSCGNIRKSIICNICTGEAGSCDFLSGMATTECIGCISIAAPSFVVPQIRVRPFSDATTSRFVSGSQLNPVIRQPDASMICPSSLPVIFQIRTDEPFAVANNSPFEENAMNSSVEKLPASLEAGSASAAFQNCNAPSPPVTNLLPSGDRAIVKL